jgi:hypothetical protein
MELEQIPFHNIELEQSYIVAFGYETLFVLGESPIHKVTGREIVQRVGIQLEIDEVADDEFKAFIEENKGEGYEYCIIYKFD